MAEGERIINSRTNYYIHMQSGHSNTIGQTNNKFINYGNDKWIFASIWKKREYSIFRYSEPKHKITYSNPMNFKLNLHSKQNFRVGYTKGKKSTYLFGLIGNEYAIFNQLCMFRSQLGIWLYWYIFQVRSDCMNQNWVEEIIRERKRDGYGFSFLRHWMWWIICNNIRHSFVDENWIKVALYLCVCVCVCVIWMCARRIQYIEAIQPKMLIQI